MDYLRRKKIKRTINAASLLLAAVSLYFLLKPFWPQITYQVVDKPQVLIAVNKSYQKSDRLLLRGAPLVSETLNKLTESFSGASQRIVPGDKKVLGASTAQNKSQKNHVVIKKIGVDTNILEGLNESVLNRGVWRLPYTSTPDKGGNTVLTAHRYLEKVGPRTFYHLDKIEVGDKITVMWEGVEYQYDVISTQVVPSTAVEVEKPTLEPILTLYTCTPLWTSKDRIVVRAKLTSWTGK